MIAQARGRDPLADAHHRAPPRGKSSGHPKGNCIEENIGLRGCMGHDRLGQRSALSLGRTGDDWRAMPTRGQGTGPPPAVPDTGVQPLRRWRAERLLSIRGLAREAGVAPSTIYLIEAGRSAPRPAAIRAIAAALGVEPAAVTEFRRAMDRAARPRDRRPR